jgi:hypothetical protein
MSYLLTYVPIYLPSTYLCPTYLPTYYLLTYEDNFLTYLYPKFVGFMGSYYLNTNVMHYLNNEVMYDTCLFICI